MKANRLEMPAGQSWTCHGCAHCCRNDMVVPLSPAEKERIERQAWTVADGVDPARMIVDELNQSRLGHQADGSCVFLDAAKRCRIHAKFGEAAKPLACRLYPFTILPGGKMVMVGLRFSCPSAVGNQGKPLNENAAGITRLAREVLPEGAERPAPPAVAATPGLDWPDFLRFVHWLEVALATGDVPVALRLLRGLHFLDAVENGCLDQIMGESADEILEALVHNAAERRAELPEPPSPPSRFGRLFLRLLVLENTRVTTVADRNLLSGHRWQLFVAGMRFAAGAGLMPSLREELQRVPFAAIEQSFGAMPPAAEALLLRYFRVKVHGLQFCGRGFFERPLIEGFRYLALQYPVIVWVARWLAASAGRNRLLEADLAKAVLVADHQYGFTPYLGWRTRLLQQRDDVARLCAWYAR